MSFQNIYDTANQLEREIRQLPELETIRTALEAIQAHEASRTLFDTYKKTVQDYSERERQGQDLSEDELKNIDELSKKIIEDKYIKALIDAEYRMDQIIRDLNHIITLPLRELYQGA